MGTRNSVHVIVEKETKIAKYCQWDGYPSVRGVEALNVLRTLLKPTKTQTFEEAIKRLEEIVGQLEKGEVPLDKTLSLFEEGVRLSRFCREKLDEAEKRIDILLKEEGGILRREPFSFQPEDTSNQEDL
jgi:exodeoxyribonuclease VII small subunit